MHSALQRDELTIQLLGPFQARLNGCWLPSLRFRKSQWILALLILRGGCPVERDWLCGVLWVDRNDRQALRNSLTNLRKALGPHADRLYALSQQTVAFDPTGASVDVLAFDAAVASADPISMREAVALYRGPLLEGCLEEWVCQEREMREQAELAALDQLAAVALEAGRLAEAEQYLRRAVATDPVRECSLRALLRVLAARGNYVAAQLLYRDLRLRLHRELNAEPDAETQAVFEQVRSEARTRAANG